MEMPVIHDSNENLISLDLQRLRVELHDDGVVVQGEAEDTPEAVLVGGEVQVGAWLLRLVELREKRAAAVPDDSVWPDL